MEPFSSSLLASLSAAAKGATALARDSVGAALSIEEASIEYDEMGRAIFTPLTPGGTPSDQADAERAIAGLIDERDELREQTNAELVKVQNQLTRQLEQMEQRRETAEARARAALAREQDAEQRALALEVERGEADAAHRRAVQEGEKLRGALSDAQASAAEALAQHESQRR